MVRHSLGDNTCVAHLKEGPGTLEVTAGLHLQRHGAGSRPLTSKRHPVMVSRAPASTSMYMPAPPLSAALAVKLQAAKRVSGPGPGPPEAEEPVSATPVPELPAQLLPWAVCSTVLRPYTTLDLCVCVCGRMQGLCLCVCCVFVVCVLCVRASVRVCVGLGVGVGDGAAATALRSMYPTHPWGTGVGRVMRAAGGCKGWWSEIWLVWGRGRR